MPLRIRELAAANNPIACFCLLLPAFAFFCLVLPCRLIILDTRKAVSPVLLAWTDPPIDIVVTQ